MNNPVQQLNSLWGPDAELGGSFINGDQPRGIGTANATLPQANP